MAEDINYAELIDKTPPEGLVAWAMQQGCLSKEYLIYKAGWVYEPLTERKRPAVEICCSACNGRFVAEKVDACGCRSGYAPAPFGFRHPELNISVISGDNALCPLCGAEAELVHIGNIRYGVEENTFVAVPGRVALPGKTDRFVLIDWKITRHIGKDGLTAFSLHPWTAWVVEERKVIRLRGYYKYFSTLSTQELTQNKVFQDDFGRADMIWPTAEVDILGTTAENSKLDKYIQQGGVCLVAYLALWRKKPTIENLVMQGYGKLVDDLIDSDQTSDTYSRNKGIPKLKELNWKEKKPHCMLHMSKEEFRGAGRILSKDDFAILLWARKAGLPVCLTADMALLKYLGYTRKMLLELTGVDDFWKHARYIQKQKSDVYTLRDYRRDAGTAGWDLNDPAIAWPKNLKAAHDRAAEAARTKVDKENAKLFQARSEALSKYAASFDGILIRPAKNQTELTREGKALHHCVAGYAKSVAEGKTAIFFIRRAEKPDEPWYTLELDEIALRVRQNRGLRNCDRTEEVTAFEEKWSRWLRAGAKKDEDGSPVLPKDHQKERKQHE